MILVSGCQFAAPGDRAGSNDQCFTQPCETVCPAGETCSPDTPVGLFFASDSLFGELFGSAGPHPVAEGGTQRIQVFRDKDGFTPFSPFDATATTPIEITQVDAPSVTVRGGAAGSGFLRIIDPDDGALHDRIAIQVLPITSARITDTSMALFDWEGSETLDLALFAGSGVSLGLLLYGGESTRLVDYSTTFTITGDAMEGGDVALWDQRSVTVGASGSVSVSVKTGSGMPFDVTMPVVDKIDDIVAIKNVFSKDLSQPLDVGSEQMVCFRGMADTRVVAGLSWVFSGEGQIEAKTLDAMCASIKPLAVGNASIVVEAGGMTKSFPVTMKASAKANAPVEKASFPREVHLGPTPGERAND